MSSGKEAHDEAEAKPGARIFDLSARPMRGSSAPEGFATDGDLENWIQQGVSYAKTLPRNSPSRFRREKRVAFRQGLVHAETHPHRSPAETRDIEHAWALSNRQYEWLSIGMSTTVRRCRPSSGQHSPPTCRPQFLGAFRYRTKRSAGISLAVPLCVSRTRFGRETVRNVADYPRSTSNESVGNH